MPRVPVGRRQSGRRPASRRAQRRCRRRSDARSSGASSLPRHRQGLAIGGGGHLAHEVVLVRAHIGQRSPEHGASVAGGKPHARRQLLGGRAALDLGNRRLPFRDHLVDDRRQPVWRQHVREVHQDQEFRAHLVPRLRPHQLVDQHALTLGGDAVDLLVRAALLLDAAAGHQTAAAEFGERRVDRAKARDEEVAERVLEAALYLVAGLVALGQYAEAKRLDVHGGSPLRDLVGPSRIEQIYIGSIYGRNGHDVAARPEVDAPEIARVRRSAPPHSSLQRPMMALGSRYGAQGLALLIEFPAGSPAICREETARLRGQTGGAARSRLASSSGRVLLRPASPGCGPGEAGRAQDQIGRMPTVSACAVAASVTVHSTIRLSALPNASSNASTIAGREVLRARTMNSSEVAATEMRRGSRISRACRRTRTRGAPAVSYSAWNSRTCVRSARSARTPTTSRPSTSILPVLSSDSRRRFCTITGTTSIQLAPA